MTRSKFNLSISIIRIDILFSILILFFLFQPVHGQKLSKEFISVVGHSNFVFSGSIIYNDSSNINAHTTGKTAIVRIDSVFDAAKSFFNIKGREITVLLADSTFHTPNIRSVFYTTGWYYGKTLGVREVNNSLYNLFPTNLRKMILAAREEIKDNLLAGQLKQATLVIQGRVIRTNIDTLKTRSARSEHDPKLRAAILEIKRMIKGTTSAKTVLFYYASSFDVLWENSPKPEKNTQAIYLLHKGQGQPVLKQTDYSLFYARDVQPYNQVNKVKRLLKK